MGGIGPDRPGGAAAIDVALKSQANINARMPRAELGGGRWCDIILGGKGYVDCPSGPRQKQAADVQRNASKLPPSSAHDSQSRRWRNCPPVAP